MILLIAASQVARITDMGHWCPARIDFYKLSDSSQAVFSVGWQGGSYYRQHSNILERLIRKVM
jgi:hypothetical protein